MKLDINIDLTEFNKLRNMLDEKHIPYEYNTIYVCDGLSNQQLIYPSKKRRKSDVIIGFGTYGSEDGLLEQMGLIPNKPDLDVEGWLTAEVVFKRWYDDYNS